MDLSYFFSFGIFWLIILTYQDFKKGKIDSRYNWFMSGVVGSMIYLSHPPLFEIVLFIGVAVLFSMIISKVVGKGDIAALGWIILGLGLVDAAMVVVFFLMLVSFSLIHYSLRFISKIEGKVAFYPVIFGTFLVTLLTFL